MLYLQTERPDEALVAFLTLHYLQPEIPEPRRLEVIARASISPEYAVETYWIYAEFPGVVMTSQAAVETVTRFRSTTFRR